MILINKYSENKEVDSFMQSPEVLEMKKFPQHINTNTWEHCRHVANMSLAIAESMNIKVNRDELIRGAALHDYNLYDIKAEELTAWKHGTRHAKMAETNAESKFNLTEKEKGIILSHMWPLNITSIPKSKEAWIVCLADKVCATQEEVCWSNNVAYAGESHKDILVNEIKRRKSAIKVSAK